MMLRCIVWDSLRRRIGNGKHFRDLHIRTSARIPTASEVPAPYSKRGCTLPDFCQQQQQFVDRIESISLKFQSAGKHSRSIFHRRTYFFRLETTFHPEAREKRTIHTHSETFAVLARNDQHAALL